MDKVEKYRINFVTAQGHLARVMFLYEGYTGNVTLLEGGARPFVLREFNTEEDLFKPLRPQLAEIQIVTNNSDVLLDDFLANSESEIEVHFLYYDLNQVYWKGFVMQEDFQEEWQDQNHVIKITATEGLGLLKNIQLSNNDVEIEGVQTPWSLIQYATQGLALDWSKYMIINNLYHDSMLDTAPNTCLDQCKIDPKTFETDPTFYDSSYEVLEKINSSFNQTIFLYRNMWHIMRMEELYTSGNIRGFLFDGENEPISYNKRYDLLVGVNEGIKPIAPEMLRFIKRITNEDIIKFNFERFTEIIKNSSFIRGDLINALPTQKRYTVKDWTLLEGDMSTFSAPSFGALERVEEYSAINGPIVDTYVRLPQTNIPPSVGLTSKDYLMQSQLLQVFIGEKIEIDIDHRFLVNFTTKETMRTFYVRLNANDGSVYTLDDEGKWFEADPFGPPEIEYKEITVEYNGKGNVNPLEWNTSSVSSEPIPDNGFLSVYFICPNDPWASGQARLFKSFKFEIINRFDGYQEGLDSQESKFTKDSTSKYNENYELYIDDSFNSAYKGSLFELDGTTLTDNNWYRFRYPGERNSFHKQNLIARWSQNKFNRNKIDANFYGLTWDDESVISPIGLINTIKFVDDDPNKIYAIVNLKEIDFSSSTWSATLQEVWDEDRDAGSVAKGFSAPVKTGVFNNTYSVGYTSPDQTFLSTADNKMIYTGYDALNTEMSASASGLILDLFPDVVPPATQDVTFSLKQNGNVIASNTITLTTNPSDATPRPFSIFLSSGTIVINPYDIFEVTITINVVKIQIQAGSFQLPSYSIPKALDYNNYSEKYIYK